MSNWYRFHLDDSIKAVATSDRHRFFVHMREPHGSNRSPLQFSRWKLSEAQEAADRVVQAYYPHDCATGSCDIWRKED